LQGTKYKSSIGAQKFAHRTRDFKMMNTLPSWIQQ